MPAKAAAQRVDAPGSMTSEEVVRMFRADPEMREVVRLCYLDEDVVAAAERFWRSEEYAEIRRLCARWLGRGPLRILDLGAGSGISSYAFARDGHQVVGVEPDPSGVVGKGAFEALARASGVAMECVSALGENLPPAIRDVDLAYTRQVLHHAGDLRQMARELHRVVRPGGFVLATREHVISRPEQLAEFLERHATHKYVGGEHAFLLEEYLDAFREAGFRVRRVMSPAATSINRFPETDEMFRDECARAFGRRLGERLGRGLSRLAPVLAYYARRRDAQNDMPGRMYSFLFQR